MGEDQAVVVDGWLQTMKETNPSVVEKLQKCLGPGHFDDGAKIRNTRVIVRDERFLRNGDEIGGTTNADPTNRHTDEQIHMRDMMLTHECQ